MSEEVLTFGSTGAATMLYRASSNSILVVEKETPIQVRIDDAGSKHQHWGVYDSAPANYIHWAGKTIGKSLIFKKARFLLEGGLRYGNKSIDKDKIVFKPILDPEIEDFLERTRIDDYLFSAAVNAYTFQMITPQLIFNRKGDIYSISNEGSSPELFRYAKPAKNKRTTHGYINPDWYVYNQSYEQAYKLGLVDKYAPSEQYRLKNPVRLIYDAKLTHPGDFMYPKPVWWSAYESGWMQVAAEIPAFKQKLIQNAVHIRYIIRVNAEYMEAKHPGFSNMLANEKNNKLKEEFAKIDRFLHDDDVQGAIFSSFDNVEDGKVREGLTIDTIDPKMGDNTFASDLKEADFHTMAAFDIPPALLGATPAGSEVGSGSSVKELYGIYTSSQQVFANLILEPLKYAFRHNGYHTKANALWFASLNDQFQDKPVMPGIIQTQAPAQP